MKTIKNLPIGIKVPLILLLILIIPVILFFVWNEINVEGQEEFEHAATINYYQSKDCINNCLVYGRSVNVKKKDRNYLIDAIKLGKIEGSRLSVNDKIIDPSSWQCQKEKILVDATTERLQEGTHYDCWPQ